MARTELRLEKIEENDYARWDKFVAESSTGSIYSTSTYLDILCSATGGNFEIITVSKGDELQAGVALYRENGSGGTVIASRLLLYYNGIVLRDFNTKYPSERTSRQLAALSTVEEYLRGLSASRLLFHCRNLSDTRIFAANGWQVWPTYSYVMEFEDTKEAFGRMEQNLRRLVNRADKNEVQFFTEGDFDSFFELHYQTHARKGSPLYLEKPAYEKYVSRLKEKKLAKIYAAAMPDGKIVASQLSLLGDHPVTHTVCAGADPDFMKHGTTPFLRWKACEDLAKAGYRANDLTDAALNPVTRFKGQLGARLVTNFVIQRPDSLNYKMMTKARGAASALKRKLGKK